MYQGYLRFAGTEIANAARTAAYVKNILPTMGFTEKWGHEGLACILEDGTYRTPALDPAPWFSEGRPASAKFFGFYPLGIEGIEDSSREVKTTELASDGSVFGKVRRAQKEFRVRGLLLGEDQEGLSSGLSWLRGALETIGCNTGNCVGDSFCYYAYLPECCDYSDEEVWPVQVINESWESDQSVTAWQPYLMDEARGDSMTMTNDGLQVSMTCGDVGIQYFAEGLIPGQPYRLAMDIVSNQKLFISITGRELDETRRPNVRLDPRTSPWVYDFIAEQTNETIRVVNAADDCTPALMKVYATRLTRTPTLVGKFKPRFRATDVTEPASWRFDDLIDGVTVARNVPAAGDIEGMTLTWLNNSGASATLSVTAGVKRLIRGLELGRSYTIFVNVAASITSGVTPVPRLSLEGIPSATVTSYGTDWYGITFKANAAQVFLRIDRKDPTVLANLASTTFHVRYIRADINTSRMSMEVTTQGDEALRSLYGVTLINGPNVISHMRGSAPGAMMEVEFTFAAARPFIYSETFPVPLSPEATTFLVPQGSCKHGLPVRTNKFTNPYWMESLVGGINVHATPSPVGGAIVDGEEGFFSQTATSDSSYVQVESLNGTNEVQRATITGGPTSGQWTLKFRGRETLPLGIGASAAAVQAALEALVTIERGNVIVTKSGSQYTISFKNYLGQENVDAITAAYKFKGGSNPAVAMSVVTQGASGAFARGHTYTVTATFNQDAAQGAGHPNARRIVVTTGGTTIESPAAINTSGKQRVSVNFVHAGFGQPVVRFWNGEDGSTVEWGEILVEEGGISGTTFDGETQHAEWNGTKYQSTSTWTAPNPAIIVDPDCPTPPSAPQPPSITPACVNTSSEWRRYWIEVPPRLSGGWQQAVPVVQLTTRDEIVRSVRVRMYPNPNKLGVEDVEPCSYCGEFYISYIPKSTVMTIDGIYRTARAAVGNTPSQSVMHLVSDADYGPIRWPQMTCDMPYFMTIDIAPDEVLSVDVQLGIALME